MTQRDATPAKKPYRYDRLTWPQIAEAIERGAVVLLPVGEVEDHGHHLPLDTDNVCAGSLCEAAAEHLGGEALVLPTQCYGYDPHHMDFPGTISISMQNFLNFMTDITNSVAHHGFKRIVIVNGHGGNDAAVRVAATDVALVQQVTIAAASYWTIAGPALIADGRVKEIGQLPGHAGAFETSLVMALREELVDKPAYPPARAQPPFEPDMTTRAQVSRAGQLLGQGPGYTDDPSRASVEHGNHLLGIISREVATFLVDFARA